LCFLRGSPAFFGRAPQDDESKQAFPHNTVILIRASD
jgi:hypothetical protein